MASNLNLDKFINKYCVYEENKNYTHISIYPKKKYNLFTTAKKIEEFWNIYIDHIKDNYSMVGLAECPRLADHGMPVIADIDLSENINNNEKLYNIEQVISLIKIYQDIIREIVDIEDNLNLLDCIFLSKDPYFDIEKGLKKHGFHLHFPKLYITKKDQQIFLLPRVIEKVKEIKLFGEKCPIDNNIYSVPWLLYKSRKTPTSDPYIVDKIYNHKLKEITLNKLIENFTFKDAHFTPFTIEANSAILYLPRLLSISDNTRDIEHIKTIVKEKYEIDSFNEIKEKKEKINHFLFCDDITDEEIRKVELMVDILNPKRSEERFEWLKIGWILKKISLQEEIYDNQLLQIWKTFSQKCPQKYDEKICEEEWEKMKLRENGYTVGTLHYLSKLDNENLYYKICEKESYENKLMIHASFYPSDHSRLLDLLSLWFKDTIVYYAKTWLVFIKDKKNSGWEIKEENAYFYNLFDSEIYIKFQNLYYNLKKQTDKGEETNMMQKYLVNLGNYNYRTTIINAAKNKFCDSKVYEKIDKNEYKVRFQNGTYDLINHELYNGIPEDYMSKKLPINYVDYSKQPNKIRELEIFLEQIFPKPEIRKYFLDTYCTIFIGINMHKNIVFWTGNGDNGKSITQKLFEKMLGKLSVKADTTIFTGKKVSTGAAIPELARAQPPTRFFMLEEPDSSENFQIGMLKKITGSDSILARDLFQKGSEVMEYVPTFKIALICNNIPKVETPDEAFWSRIKILPFMSTFIEKKDLINKKNESYFFEKDKKMGDKLVDLAPIFAWYLLDWYKNKYPHNQDIEEPSDVLIATSNFRNATDIMYKFINECIEGAEGSILKLDSAYFVFTSWYKEEGIKLTRPSKDIFKTYCNKAFLIKDNSTREWNGLRLKQKEIDIL